MTVSASTAHLSMLRMVSGFGLAHAIYIAAELGLADLLRREPARSEDLARITGVHAPSLDRVLRALAGARICVRVGQGCYSLTPLGETLRSDVPDSLRAWVRVVLGEECCTAWSHLMQSVRTGEIAFNTVFGTDVWTYRAAHPSMAAVFDEAMGKLANLYDKAVLSSYSFAQFRKVIDVGGGNGSFLIALLEAHEGLAGVLFDLPHVAEKARHNLEKAGCGTRCTVVAGDAFSGIPEGGDAYVLSRVIHDWDDDRAIAILRNCRRAMTPDAKLVLIERVLPEGSSDAPAAQEAFISDLQMMAMNGGRERTAREYEMLFQRSGFALARVVPTGSVVDVVEGARA